MSSLFRRQRMISLNYTVLRSRESFERDTIEGKNGDVRGPRWRHMMTPRPRRSCIAFQASNSILPFKHLISCTFSNKLPIVSYPGRSRFRSSSNVVSRLKQRNKVSLSFDTVVDSSIKSYLNYTSFSSNITWYILNILFIYRMLD